MEAAAETIHEERRCRVLVRRRRGWEIPEREATPERLVLNRRHFLGALAGASALAACSRKIDAEELKRKLGGLPAPLAAERNPAFTFGGELTERAPTLLYNNFYEFTESKDVWRHVRASAPGARPVAPGRRRRSPRRAASARRCPGRSRRRRGPPCRR
jgi:hypothetical protein